MAIVLPAVGTWPGTHPVGVLEPGCIHTDSHVHDLVETEHYLCAYYGAQHFSQCWPEKLASGWPIIHIVSNAYATILEYVIVPRHHCTALRFTYRADGGADGGNIRITAVEPAVNVVINLAAGMAEGYADLAAVNSEDTAITIKVEIKVTDDDIVDLWALGCYDLNMTQAELAAL
jgi:hypothetical protein